MDSERKASQASSRTAAVGTSSDQPPEQGNSFAVTAPSITLPKGGGAIRGMGEKFAANPVTGTGSMSVPIATSPGRGGFGPQLSLSYDSGAGNGPFGFGWSLSLPQITRKTDKGLPQYLDAEDSDVFILSGAEDLVPVYRQDPDGSWVADHHGFTRDPDPFWVRDEAGRLVIHEDPRTIGGSAYIVRRYRPRIEGLFARIERWTRDDGDVHWRSLTRDNILTLYGKDTNARIVDSEDATRIFSWLICETRDDKGNAVLYKYKAEDGADLDLALAHEANRGDAQDARRQTNRYIKHIFYGNRRPMLDGDGKRPSFLASQQIRDAGWMFEVVFDYGEHHSAVPKPGDDGDWKRRSDPFSSYRAGFEVRTYRLCQRVLMFHHFPDEKGVGADCLVRSTDLTFSQVEAEGPIYSFLISASHSGYVRQGAGYLKRSLPPVEFEYTRPVVQTELEEVDAESLENLPTGLDGAGYQWIDLHGEGIPGILTEQAGAWFYKRNTSPINVRKHGDRRHLEAQFAHVELVAAKPNLSLGGGAQFMDLAGDGQPDLVVLDGPLAGLYEHDEAESWGPFRPFNARLSRAMNDRNLRFVDLDGDGHGDVLITEGDAFVWHPSLAEDGFGPALRVAQALDEEQGPKLVFADGEQAIYLADLSGDGLTDLARIRNGEVCYWPNLGYGRFGAKVTMDNSPTFDQPDQFDQARIRMADVDGSGTTDILYLHRDGIRLYFNQSGNGWSAPQVLDVFPHVDSLVDIQATDLLGNGTACLVWSSPLPGDGRRQMRYVNLMGDQKPHLLVKTVNNLGAETRVRYAPSTQFYLQDKAAGRPWITRLPFPVHVVERVETFDAISRNRFVTRYAYHHGYFDGEEREFRGFGMVEQFDTEEFASLTAEGELPTGDNVDAASHVPPVLTRTWFHTGIYLGREQVSRQFEHEYYRETGLSIETARPLLLDDTILPASLTLDEEREAARSLKGMMLRQEVYALDGTQKAVHPYTVVEQNFTIRSLQPKGAGENEFGVFFSHPREAISYHYERVPGDPRVQHALTLEVDAFGNVLKAAAVGYGRRQPDLALPTDGDRDRQAIIHITVTENGVTNAITDQADHYRTPLPSESRTYELRKRQQDRSQAGLTTLFRFDDLVLFVRQSADGNHDIEYEDLAFAKAQQPAPGDPPGSDPYFRRLIERVRTRYRKDDLTTLLAFGELEPLALPGESHKLAFTPGLLSQVFRRPHQGQPDENLLPDPAAVLGSAGEDGGGYLDLDDDDHWWIPSGQAFYSDDPTHTTAEELAEARAHFFLPRRYRDPFGQQAVVELDGNDLLMVETQDALGNTVRAENDYRVLAPRLMTDPNGNRSEVAFDTLGMVAGAAVMGKPVPAPVEGDTLAGFVADLTPQQLDQFMAAPRQPSAEPRESEATPIVYDLLQGATTRIVYDLNRFQRLGEPPFAATIARETHVSDLSQNGRSKLQVSFSYSDGFGREIQKKIQAEPGPVPQRDGTGKIIVGADGQPVMTLDPASPRWVGSGSTVFNNKGKPVRQYEPYFTDRHTFEFDVRIGVSSVLFYDPAGRVVATLHPNHTWEKVVFDPWKQTTHDVNDTVTLDPSADDDVKGFFVNADGTPRLPADEYLPTWHGMRTDPAHTAAFEALYPNAGDRANETRAAVKAEAHAGTPATAHFDALGRPFLTVARNRVVCTDHPLDGKPDEDFRTRVELDIEGNQRAVLDERRLPDATGLPLGALEQRIVMRYDYDMLGSRIHQASMEAGERWSLNDVAGNPIRVFDSRGHNFSTAYDALRRPIEQTVLGTTADSDPRTRQTNPLLVDRIEYGEPPLSATPAQEIEAQRLNLRTRIVRHRDSTGIATSARLDTNGNPVQAYDFKGNLLRSTRQLASDYKAIPNWSQSPSLDVETFEASTRYDALNRPIQSIAPHGSLTRPGHPNKLNVIQPFFNEANLLERLDVWLERAAEPDGLLEPSAETPSPVGVDDIDYDAKGQRLRIDYKNGASTFYRYDPLTFRLTRLYTRRGAAFTADCDNPEPRPPTIAAPDEPLPGRACGLQNLHYTYDPAGNITHIQDDAQQTIFFRNQRVEPSADYTYDAVYRLVKAKGREHLGQNGNQLNPPTPPDAFNPFHMGHDQPNDRAAMGTYTERYVYDAVGNFLAMQHHVSDPTHPDWERTYGYNETSLLEDGTGGTLVKTSNRLSSTTVEMKNGVPVLEPYTYDAHGNMLKMPHLALMAWDYRDQLQATSQQFRNSGTPAITYYVYDASGQRTRKVTEGDAPAGQTPTRMKERIYLGGFEIYREYENDGETAKLERETLHIMDDQQRIALVETKTIDAQSPISIFQPLTRSQLGNHLGSSSLELDGEGQIISYEEYFPYGSTSYQAARKDIDVPAKRYRYAAMERDEESGLNYHSARYCAPWVGRWTSGDPTGLVGGLNLFIYANDSPILLVDVTGRKPGICFPVNADYSRVVGPIQCLPPLPEKGSKSGPKKKPGSKEGIPGGAGGGSNTTSPIGTIFEVEGGIGHDFTGAGDEEDKDSKGTGTEGGERTKDTQEHGKGEDRGGKEADQANGKEGAGGTGDEGTGDSDTESFGFSPFGLFSIPRWLSYVLMIVLVITAILSLASLVRTLITGFRTGGLIGGGAAAAKVANTVGGASGLTTLTQGVNQVGQAAAAPPPVVSPTGETALELIARSEAAGGHLVEKHVGETMDALARRLASFQKLTEVSTFNSVPEMEAAIGAAFQTNAATVTNWVASGAHDRLVLNAPFSGGSVLVRGVPYTYTGTGVRVILQGNGSGGWHILTGFPTL